ncbi:MAG: hypothetical protein HYZ51_03835 [Candidatus Doudnabacteria bacterium]|nr:hypothetical protein [Candidatus Doudnabacteria bacterium]
MNETRKARVIEQPPYDWTKGRKIEFANEHDRQYPALLGYEVHKTPEERRWWKKIYEEIGAKISNGESVSLSYLSHPTLGKLIAFWNKTRAEISQRENYAGINEKQHLDKVRPETKSNYLQARSFRLQWADRILNGELPAREELAKNTEVEDQGLEYKLRSFLLQGVVLKHDEMALKLPYIGLVSFEEAQLAIKSLLEQRMREVIISDSTDLFKK